ncbi:SYP71 [Scenedesmus sp. PABB004]|nr:SYP71 [Scenedesmus sp. PABB004]
MSLYDLQQRTDAILKKYDKYDKTMGKRRETKGDDPFVDEMDMLEGQVEDLNRQAEEVAVEKNRAIVATRNAEIRKAKQLLLTDGVQALQKLKKKGKGVNKLVIEEREKKVQQLIEKIFAVPDGIGGNRRPIKPGVALQMAKGASITLGPLDPQQNSPLHFKQTEETAKFEQRARWPATPRARRGAAWACRAPRARPAHAAAAAGWAARRSQEWQHARVRQDAQLERIERGVGTLGEMARGMQEELDKQTPVIDDIDNQLNKVTGQLKTNNAKLTGLITQMRSKRNFCIDIVLVCVLLGIGAYIFTAATKKKS